MGREELYKFEVDKNDADAPNIRVYADKGEIRIVANAFKLFNTMRNIKIVLLGLNDKINELIQMHLNSQAKTESGMNGEANGERTSHKEKSSHSR